MEQPPASAKSHQAAPGTPQLTVNERSVDDQAYEQQVQKDFYKKSRESNKIKALITLFNCKRNSRKILRRKVKLGKHQLILLQKVYQVIQNLTQIQTMTSSLSVDNDASWANDGSDNSDDEKTNSSARTSGFLSPPSE